MEIKIALAGNPNSGKTTLFNALTGANQFVGNWPGVTVEKKEGKLKKHSDVTIMDLPGIYSLSPYTLEEVVARNYLINERPDAILNIVDGTNLERNLYLSTQLTELGIPVVVAVNMMDVVKKRGDSINIEELSRQLDVYKRQSIARALARQPEILIFDDSFSALDYKTDSMLRKGLKEHLGNTTRMIVAQRIGTIRDADKIVVLDEGRAVGIGRHEELLKNCPVYREIAMSQLSAEELGE